MKVIIAGSRDVESWHIVPDLLCIPFFVVSEVVSGGARGVDLIGEREAWYRHIAVRRFPADWNGMGKRAGYIRNAQMAEYADAVIRILDASAARGYDVAGAIVAKVAYNEGRAYKHGNKKF